MTIRLDSREPVSNAGMRTRRWISQGASLALHIVLIAGLAGVRGRPPRVLTSSTSAQTVRVVMMQKKAAAAEPPQPDRSDAEGIAGDPDLHVGAFTFDIDRIARRRNLLFPFVTDDLAFASLARSLSNSDDEGMTNPYAKTTSTQGRALVLDASALQGLIDRAWSRRDRWKSFSEIRQLIDEYDGDRGAVPVVLRTYLAQNILQPYFESSIPDPRVWVMLALSADHVDFIDFIAAYTRAHPSSKTTTELLFLLDKLVQGNRDALIALVTLDVSTQAGFTRRSRPDAFNLLLDIQAHYKRELGRRGILTPDRLVDRYNEVRLTLLNGIIDRTPHGYRVNDARYLIGVIHWRASRREEALRVWRGIHPDPTDAYFIAYSRVLADMHDGLSVDSRAITSALDAEDGRWLMSSYERLRKFGYRFDTY